MLRFEPPRRQEMTVFTRLPDEFRRRETVSSWARANRLGAAGDSFLEAPVFDRAGNLYVTDIEYGRIFVVDGQGAWHLVCEYDGEPNGMKFLSDSELLVADYRNGLVVVDVQSGSVSAFLDRRNSERFKGVNDLVFDSVGNLYFTDQGQTGLHDPTGRVYRLAVDGRLDMLLHDVPSPNGLVLDGEERVLYVAATRGNCVWRVPLMTDGGVSKVGQFFTSHGPAGPDGLAMDVEGHLLVANPGLGVIWRLDPYAQPTDVLVSPTGRLVTNLAFGGEDRRTVFATESETGAVLRADLPAAGRPLHVPRRG